MWSWVVCLGGDDDKDDDGYGYGYGCFYPFHFFVYFLLSTFFSFLASCSHPTLLVPKVHPTKHPFLFLFFFPCIYHLILTRW